MVSVGLGSQDLHTSILEQQKIHLCNQIQPHGVLLALQEPDLNIVQVSGNIQSILGLSPEAVTQMNLEDLLDPIQVERIKAGLKDNLELLNPVKIWTKSKDQDFSVFDGIFHRNLDGILLLELEPALSHHSIPFLGFYYLARTSVSRIESAASLHDFCQVIVQEVRNMTGFDRVMLYKFDPDGHGEVVAEDKIDAYESYLGLHFPESDIPKQARHLFTCKVIRQIPDAHEPGVAVFPAVNPINDLPLDLTLSALRSAHPCHLEYLHNMQVGASLTISLIKDGQLWGLIACHHQEPKYVAYELRRACEFLGRLIFAELSSREEMEDYGYQMRLAEIQSHLIDRMAQAPTFLAGLTQQESDFLALTQAQGAAIHFGGSWITVGRTPQVEDLNTLIHWLTRHHPEEMFWTDNLAQQCPGAEGYKNVASGILAIPLSRKSYVLWFRPEVLQTVNWGGDPTHSFAMSTAEDGLVRLTPRKSFEIWKETVRLHSLAWKPVEIRAAQGLQEAIINLILKQADELAELAHDLELSNAELKRFAYVASHDLQEPLNQVANFVQLLALRYQEQLDDDANEFINFAVQGVGLMQTLIDDVLAYSKVDMQGSELELTEADGALNRALANLRGRIAETGAEVIRDPLPSVVADSTQLMQLFQNLVGNAIKFRSQTQPVIRVRAERLEDEWLFSVQDNGIGIDPQFKDRIFVIFQRLHTRDEYPGTGMGLAICKKIVECHRGRIWVDSQRGQGATFYFTIPLGRRGRERRA
jgi:chemotaxis family two-component system sensor kinase Cph1